MKPLLLRQPPGLPAFSVAVGLFAAMFGLVGCSEKPPKQTPPEPEKQRVFTWEKDADSGVVVYEDILSLRQTDDFPLSAPEEEKNGWGHDTIGTFLRKNGFLWITAANPGSYDQPAWFCARQKTDKQYELVKIGGPEALLGECASPETYMVNCGPYILIHRLSHGSGYCGTFPLVFRLNGEEIDTDGINFSYWSCEADAQSDKANCMSAKYVFGYEKNLLTVAHREEWMKEAGRKIFETKEYTARYRVINDKLKVLDTVGVSVTKH